MAGSGIARRWTAVGTHQGLSFSMVETKTYDLAVIGGGINGCGIARDAAGRGLSVVLAEKRDLASATSSASTKLIHGGLRYLESYAFGMVRDALNEREVLLRAAPHIIWPLRFVLPHHGGLRPAWFIRLGLFLYDHLGGRERLAGSRKIDLRADPAGGPLRNMFDVGFSYSDCWVDDARLVVLNAVDARARGADVRVRCEVTRARRVGGVWELSLRNMVGGQSSIVHARALVNAAGPWAADVAGHVAGLNSAGRLRHVKGSHIVVPKLFDHDSAYILQETDGRIVFAIPYEGDFTLIGTTDVDFSGDLDDVAISDDEVHYLCGTIERYFSKKVCSSDVVWSFAGVRPLYFEEGVSAQRTTRDSVIERLDDPSGAPVVNVFGGKLTSYRHLAEDVLGKLVRDFPNAGPAWTAGAPLPGGDFDVDGFDDLVCELAQCCPVLSVENCRRLVRCYGTVVMEIYTRAAKLDDLGQDFGAGLYEREVRHLVENEWARTADDIVWRRTKLGLKMDSHETERLAHWLSKTCAN